MKIYQVGPDVPYDLPGEDNQQFDWLVFWYEDGGYDGSGDAVALGKEDGLLYVKNLGHCSCYGPMDGGMESGTKYTVEQFLEDKEDIFTYDPRTELKEKVKELLPQWKAPVFSENFAFLE